MKPAPETFRGLIDDLGGVRTFADKMGLGEFAAKKMRDRNSVAVDHWPALIAVAKADKIELTNDDLVRMKLAKAPEVNAA